MNNIPFLIIRHSVGGGGRFLASCLMASKSVAHFDSAIEQSKTDKLCLDYIKQKFTNDLNVWTKTEPNPVDAWNLSFCSAKYPRGDDLSINEFDNLARTHCTPHFWDSVEQNKLISLCWHKAVDPVFTHHAKNIVIIIDPPSTKWLHRANWYKHYEIKNRGIHLKQHDPSYAPPLIAEYINKFNNPIYSTEHPYSFIKNNIVNCKFKKVFSSKENFNSLNNAEFLNLSALLDENQFIKQIQTITNNLNIDPIAESFLRTAHQHWSSCHTFKY